MKVVSCKTIYKYGKYKPQPQSSYIPRVQQCTFVPSLELGCLGLWQNLDRVPVLEFYRS
jgi:hypothetical protein